MSPDLFDSTLFDVINTKAIQLENKLSSDVVFYHGAILAPYYKKFRDFIENVKSRSKRCEDTISIVLRTGGGSAETTERMVEVLRKHYKSVYFVVPDIAMSAGTIFCMSGDKIYMDYSSSLGPIDPQVPLPNTKDFIPALGYLDKIEEIAVKSKLSEADIILLKSIDLGKLALFEQARDLSIDLLKKWLVEYKFKDWNTHRTNNVGAIVTIAEKQQRAEEIAKDLSNHKKWRSHGRNLDVKKLRELRIEIDDYSNNLDLKKAIREYNEPLTGYIDRMNENFFLHNHNII